jgi:hypothetical protein
MSSLVAKEWERRLQMMDYKVSQLEEKHIDTWNVRKFEGYFNILIAMKLFLKSH